MNDLTPMLAPKSIAILGASPDPGSVSGLVMGYLKKFGYQGKVFPVNPKYPDINGIKCYPNITAMPEAADVLMVGIGAKGVNAAIQEAAQKGIKSAIISSSGFAEVGPEGKQLQDDLRKLVKQTGIRVCGPNCNGIVNFLDKSILCFSRFLDADAIVPGKVGFITQSGALGGSFINRAQDRNIGFTYYIAPGNEVDADIVDFMSYMVDDPNTEIIAAYVEQVRDARKFLAVAERAMAVNKPIIMLKVGVSSTGAKSAASHTGAMAGSDMAYTAAFKQAGVIRVQEYDDLIDAILLLQKGKLPRGNRIGIISSSGGGSIILGDKAEQYHFEVPGLTAETRAEMAKSLPPFANVDNPLDLTWGAFRGDQEVEFFKVFARDPNVDSIVVMMTMIAGERSRARANMIVKAAEGTDKPLLTWWATGNLAQPAFDVFDHSPVALFKAPENCIKALRNVTDYAEYKRTYQQVMAARRAASGIDVDQKAVQKVLASQRSMTEHLAKTLLAAYGIPVTREGIASTPEQAAQIASQIGYPVALKISSPQIIHKSDVQGIELNLDSAAKVSQAFAALVKRCQAQRPEAVIEGCLVQEMAGKGTETIIGVSTDPTFGLSLMFGMGGIFVEIIKDVSLRILPIARSDAEKMVREIKSYPVLAGARGRAKADIPAIIDLLMRINYLATDLSSDIAEIDLNPVIVFPEGKGVKVVDARVIFK